MAENPRRRRASWRGLLSNSRHLRKRAMLLGAGKKRQKVTTASTRPGQPETDRHVNPHVHTIVKKSKGHREETSQGQHVLTLAKAAAPRHTDSWEVDSGFCSEASPPASGRNSPCLSWAPATVVALDCEMVGTGPGGRRSELARCSIVDYHGNVLFDKYVKPCRPVTDFRTRWSGIQRRHLHNAMPFAVAREEILKILEGNVVVGHSVYHDFEALDTLHPGHMVRDTSAARLLGRLAGFPRHRCASLKILSRKLLHRDIQTARSGHCSVEDARASLDLYKLVEGEWEQELQNGLMDDDAPARPGAASSHHYMHDEYWPSSITGNQ